MFLASLIAVAAVAFAVVAPNITASKARDRSLAPAVPGQPRYHNYVAPSGVGDNAGEPTLGVNWTTEQTFSNSGGSIPNGGQVNYFGGFLPYMLSVTFNDCTSPAQATWEQKPLLTANSPRVFGDPILFGDPQTGRTFVSQLEGLTPAGSTTDFTDNDGDLFLPTEGSGLPSCVDHQTIGGGPFAPGIPDRGPLELYPNAVYYASQCIADATISLSLDGGITYLPGVPMWTALQCAGLHGHIKVAPDGTVYVPNNSCQGRVGVAVSTDNGLNWAIRRYTPSTGQANTFSDPSVGIATNGRVYLGYVGADGNPRVVVSDDRGQTWYNHRDVGVAAADGLGGVGIKSSVFPAMVAGDPNRAALAFYGSTTDGSFTAPAFPGIWHLYIASTFDGGNTWTTVNATPGDPIQRFGICGSGDCRNMLDFFDAEIDKEGRVLVSWDDGCIGNCVAGPPNSFTAKATIARQSGGMRMYAQYDPVEPAIPQAPGISGFRIQSSARLSWQAPDHGGSDLTGYNLYRRTGAVGDFTLVAQLPASQTTFNDVISTDDHYYRLTAVNAIGESPYCEDFLVPEGGGLTPCVLPGLLVLNDILANGSDDDADQNTPPDASVNVRHLFIAEPYLGAGAQVWFNLEVAPSLTGVVPPNSQWYIVYQRSSVAPDGSDRRFVSMESDETGALSFRYGDFGPPIPLDGSIPPPNANSPIPLGDADAGSYDPGTGAIQIKLANSKVNATPPGAGNSLVDVNVRTYFNRPDPGQRSQNNASDITGNGIYQLVGNASCFVNNPPTARVVATPTEGEAPLEVLFDASTSSDDDDGDFVSLYTFNFGDGSNEVTQSAPTISHTYVNPSPHYFADVTVKDSYGLQSLNIARVVIEVDSVATGVDPVHAPKALGLTALGTPSQGPIYFKLALDRSGPVSVGVYDVKGRRVADLIDTSMPAGIHALRWSGLDRSGNLAASGVYFVRANAGGRFVVTRVTVVR